MSPRVQARIGQKCLRTPRIPFLLFQFDLVFKALMKEISLFIQSFFITKDTLHILALISKCVSLFIQSFFITPVSNAVDLFRIVVFKKKAFKEFFPQFYICFPTSVL